MQREYRFRICNLAFNVFKRPFPLGGDFVLRAGGSQEGVGGALRVLSGTSESGAKSGDIELITPGNTDATGSVSISTGDALVSVNL